MGVLLPQKEILKWIKDRQQYLEKQSQMLRHEDICPVSGQKIYDKAILTTSNAVSQTFERHSLLQWLLINPRNPLTNEKVSIDEIRQIFADRGNGIKPENDPKKVLQEETKRSFFSKDNAEIISKYALPLISAAACAAFVAYCTWQN